MRVAIDFRSTFQILVFEIGEVVMSLGQYFDIILKRLSLSRGEKGDRTDSIRSKRGKVIEEKAESKKSQAEVRLKDANSSANSEKNFELSEVGSKSVRTEGSNKEALRNFQNVIDLLQLSEEQAQQLGLSRY